MTDSYTGPLWVPGHPVSKGSLVCKTPHVNGRHQNLQPADKRDPDGFVAKLPDVLAWQARKVAASPIDAAVELRCEFYIAQGATTSFPDAPIGHGAGDLDKLIRQVGDAVGGSKTNPSRLITDDSRIAKIVGEKFWAPDGKEGVRVELLRYVPPVRSSGPLPVKIQAGRETYHVGSISRTADLPRILRAVADQLERSHVA